MVIKKKISPSKAFNTDTLKLAGELTVHDDCVGMNRGADFVKPLALSLRARTGNLTRHREQHNQAKLDCVVHGAGQHRDYVNRTEMNVYKVLLYLYKLEHRVVAKI